MCNWLTVNEALDLILDRGPEEDENIEPKTVMEEEAGSNGKLHMLNWLVDGEIATVLLTH